MATDFKNLKYIKMVFKVPTQYIFSTQQKTIQKKKLNKESELDVDNVTIAITIKIIYEDYVMLWKR